MMSIFNNLVPVFALMAVGHFMGRIKFVEKGFFTSADRVVYFIFFPVMLFWKIGGTDSAESINWALTSTVLGLLTGAWLLSLVYAKFTKMPANQVGAFSQCCYRFNTYVGLAVILSALGEDGVTEFGILISVVIPYLNVHSRFHSDLVFPGRIFRQTEIHTPVQGHACQPFNHRVSGRAGLFVVQNPVSRLFRQHVPASVRGRAAPGLIVHRQLSEF
jgi:hypothetical protein